MDLEEKVTLVTGGGKGIGLGISLAVAAAGGKVVLTDLDLTLVKLAELQVQSCGGDCIGLASDVSSELDVNNAVAFALDHFGRLDGIVHNANSGASVKSVPLHDVSEENWQSQVGVGLKGAFLLARAGRSALKDQEGSFVVLSSVAALDGSSYLPAYATVKAAQIGFVRSLAREWGPIGVRANCLVPSAVTPALEIFLEQIPQMRKMLVGRSALKRLGDPQMDIGGAAVFLLGRGSRFITGQCLMATGGSHTS